MGRIESIYHHYIGPSIHDSLKKYVQAVRREYSLTHPVQVESPRFQPKAPELKPNKPQTNGQVIKKTADEVSQKQLTFQAYGGQKADYFKFIASVLQAEYQNYQAHQAGIDDFRKQAAYKLKHEAMMNLITARKSGVRCVKVGIEFDNRYPKDINQACLSVEVSAVDNKKFHLPYSILIDLAAQMGYQDPSELIGEWDFTRIGISAPVT